MGYQSDIRANGAVIAYGNQEAMRGVKEKGINDVYVFP